MKKQILDALKAKFEGVSEAILNRAAEKLAKSITNEDEVADAVEHYSLQQLIESYGDSRATQAQKTAIANYEREHAKQGGEPKPEPKPKQADVEQNELPEWAKALIESNKQLAERIKAIDGERIATTRRAEYSKLTKGLPELYRRIYDRLDVTAMSDDEYTKLLDELPAEIDEIQKSESSRGAVFGRPSAKAKVPSNANQATEEELNKALETF